VEIQEVTGQDIHNNDNMSWGEFAIKTFFIKPGLPRSGFVHRISELDETVPNPSDQRVAMSLLRNGSAMSTFIGVVLTEQWCSE
jgi:hypothetical protein